MMRQGKCDDCKCAFTWTLKVRLADRRCDQCGRPLRRITTRKVGGRKVSSTEGYTWIAWR